MPNWCSNIMQVEGATPDMKRFVTALKTVPAYYKTTGWKFEKEHAEQLQFSGIYPIPKKLLVKDQREKRLRRIAHSLEKLKLPWFASLVYKFLDKQKGFPNWWKWCIENWGTKWDVCDIWLEDFVETSKVQNSHLHWEFSTAWAPPIEWLREAARQYSTLSFLLTYYEPGMNYAGEASGEEGSVSDDYVDNPTNDQLVNFGFEPWDDDEYNDEE